MWLREPVLHQRIHREGRLELGLQRGDSGQWRREDGCSGGGDLHEQLPVEYAGQEAWVKQRLYLKCRKIRFSRG